MSVLNAYWLDTPNVKVSIKELQKIGVLFWHFDPANYEKSLDGIKKRRGYNYEDTCVLGPDTPDLDKKKVTFFEVCTTTLLGISSLTREGTHSQR